MTLPANCGQPETGMHAAPQHTATATSRPELSEDDLAYSAEAHKHDYMRFHARRVAFLMESLRQLPLNANDTVLDVGRSPLTNLVLRTFPKLSTLGLPLDETLLDKADPLDTARVPHTVFNLNDCNQPSRWVVPEACRLVLFNEVMEHLQVSPTWVFRYLRELMLPDGFLIVQTPNAVSLGHRVRMCLGRNPFVEFALESEAGAHHFREYTKRELITHAAAAGLVLHSHNFVNYFPAKTAVLRALSALTGLVPAFRNGQTFVFRRPA